jgi:hypothetical protein
MHDSKAAKKMMAVFEQDWTDSAPREAKKVEEPIPVSAAR